MERIYYHHKALQRPQSDLRGSLEEDTLAIRLHLFKCITSHRVRSDPVVLENRTLQFKRDILVRFSHIKWQLSDNYDSNGRYEKHISDSLSIMGVPKDEHPAAVHKVFEVVMAAVNPEIPVVLDVLDIYHRLGDGYGHGNESCRPNSIPASRSSIEGLEQVTLDSDIITCSPCCAICLEDFDLLCQQEPITRLPCRHHFHVHCIVQCLEISHMCPLCRYPMPTEED